jgi:endonuclease G, mitochondrial
MRLRLIGLVLSVAFAGGCTRVIEGLPGHPPSSTTSNAAGPHLPFGNPSNATADPANKDNFLLTHSGFTLSYNDSRGTLNWVAWRTTAADLGAKRERPLFRPDMSLPPSFRRVQYLDYSGSGYDRGHMVPAADRFADEAMMNETFLMTNIVPQTDDLNQFVWNKLESYVRGAVRRGSDAYTIAGVYGEKHRIRDRIVVPANIWKVVVLLPRGGTQITAATRIIAVDVPNIDGIASSNWKRYLTTVRDIEQKTGYDLFNGLPRELQDRIETRPVALPAY